MSVVVVKSGSQGLLGCYGGSRGFGRVTDRGGPGGGVPLQAWVFLPRITGQGTIYCGPTDGYFTRWGSCWPPSVECGLTDTDISSVAYKTPCNNYREEMIL